VPEQHDGDEEGQLPPDLDVEEPNDVARDATYATVMALPMSSIIPGWRARSSEIAPVRSGRPPYAKMIVPSREDSHTCPGNSHAA
jgi:hypothetical protein